jgi:hypothetical protein
LITRYEHIPFLFVHVTSLDGLRALAERGEVLRVYEDRLLEHQLAESLPLIHQPSVAAGGRVGNGTSVAVLDTGCDYKRNAFGDCSSVGASGCKVAYAADFAPDDGSLDDHGHGTNVSAIVLGVAPSSKVLALDVFAGETAPSSAILSAIDWTIKNRSTYNIVALNLSLGSGMYTSVCSNDMFASALANAQSAGIVPVVAAGNAGYSHALASPACTPAAVSVGAVYDSNVGGISYGVCGDTTTAADKIACFSNSSSFLSLWAPGAVIDAGGYTMVGTSQASPHVAGAVAVMRSGFPSESVNQAVARLTQNGPSITDSRNGATKHRLDLVAAIGGGVPDTTAPAGTVRINDNAAATNTSSVTLTIGATDTGGVPSMCVSNTTTCTTFEPFATKKAWTLSSGDGVKTVRVTVRDAAGNQTLLSDDIRLDTTAPVSGALRATAGNKQVTLTWAAATDSGSGVASYRLLMAASAAPSCSSGSLIYSGTALSYTHSGLQNGTLYGYRVCPVDAARSTGTGSTASARPAPEFAAPTGGVKVNDGAAYTTSSTVTLTMNAADTSGVARMCISNSSSCSSWQTYTATKAWTLGTSVGSATVNVWFSDAYSNTTTSPAQASVIVDTVLPSIGTLATQLSGRAVTLNWTAASDANGVMAYKVVYASGSTAPPSCNTGSTLYTGPNLTYVQTGLALGNYSYRLCAVDKAGNINVGVTRTVTVR